MKILTIRTENERQQILREEKKKEKKKKGDNLSFDKRPK